MKHIKKKLYKLGFGLVSLICLSYLTSIKNEEGITKVEAQTNTKVASYIFSGDGKNNKFIVTTSGEIPLNSTAEFITVNRNNQDVHILYGTHYQTFTLHNYQNVRISKIVMEMHSNKSAGSGSFTYSVDEEPFHTIIGQTSFKNPLWYGEYINEFVNVTTLPNADVSHIDVNETIAFKVTGAGNSSPLYIRGYHITWEEITRPKSHYVKTSEEDDIAFGATYALGSATSLKMLANNIETNHLMLADGAYDDLGVIKDEAISPLILESGKDINTYALKFSKHYLDGTALYLGVSDTNEEFNLNLETAKNNVTSWEVIKNDNTFLLKHSRSNKYLIYENQNELFSLSSSPISEAVTLFLLPISKVPNIEARMYVDEVNNGVGALINTSCHYKLEYLNSIYLRLSSHGQNVYQTLDDSFFHKAQERITYLEAWTLLNEETNTSLISGKESSFVFLTLLIGALGVAALTGYFYLNKKKQ